MINRALHLAFVCLMSLGIIAQGFGASGGGVLCLGCTNAWAGVAVVNAACLPSSDCCGGSTGHTKKSCDEDQETHPEGCPDGCGCVDVTLSHNIVIAGKTSTKSILPLVHNAVIPAPVFVTQQVMVRSNASGARAGPDLVRLLVPCARQTVLLI